MTAERLVPHLKRHFRDLARLAGPVVLSRLGIVTLGIVDVAMVGHYSTRAVAALGAAESTLIVTFLGMIVGINYGTMFAVSHALGAGKKEECGAAWQRGLIFAFGVGLLAVIPCCFGEAFLTAVGQPPEVAALGGKVMLAMAIGLPFNSGVVATSYFLEGLQKPMAATIFTFGANILNLLFNWSFVFGHFGAPEMGAVGSGIATTLVRILWAGGLIAYVLLSPQFREYGVRLKPNFDWASWKTQRHMGYAAAVAFSAEIAAFVSLQIFAGWIGTVEIAVFTILNKIFSGTYMIAQGIATASSILVGHAIGRGDRQEAIFAGWTSLIAMTAIACLLILVIVLFRGPIMNVFSADPRVIALGAPLIAFAAWMVIFDSQQTVASGMLRGLGESWIPMAIQTFSFVVIMLPISWWMAFRMPWNGAVGIGLYGLFGACFLGLGASALLQSLRFSLKTR